MGELIVGQVVGDQDRELAGDAERRLEPAGETLDDPLLGEGQLGVGDGAPAGDVGQLLDDLDERFLGDGGLNGAARLERARASSGMRSSTAPRSCSPCPRGGSC